VAISGLAKEIQNETNDVYYAGLWKRDFKRTLLWYMKVPQRANLQLYRAPSWSWASVDGKVDWLAQRSGVRDSFVSVATVQTIQTFDKDGKRASTGQLEDGFCRILGTIRTVMRYERQATLHRLVLSEEMSDPHSCVDFFPDVMIKGGGFPMNAVCLPVLYYQNLISDGENQKRVNEAFMGGLVLEPTGEYRDEYRRMGIFKVSANDSRVWFDSEGAEERDITII